MMEHGDYDPDAPLDLVDPPGQFLPRVDLRPRLEQPLPVKLITVTDATLLAPAGLEPQLDDFYLTLLGFLRAGPEHSIVYRSENFDLIFKVEEPPVGRESLRTLGVEVASLAQVEHRLIDREIPYIRQKSMTPGQESLVLTDPAGNWLELTESRAL